MGRGEEILLSDQEIFKRVITLVFTRSDLRRCQILGPPQANIFRVFGTLLRGKRFRKPAASAFFVYFGH